MLDTVHCFTLKTPKCLKWDLRLLSGGGCEMEEHVLMSPLATSNAIPWINHTDGA